MQDFGKIRADAAGEDDRAAENEGIFMIYRLNTKAEDYIPELGDGFDGRIEGSPMGLQVADYYAPAEGAGVYYITYRVEIREAVEQLFVFAGRKQLLRYGSRRAGEVIEGTLYLHFSEIVPRYYTDRMAVEKVGFAVACEDLGKLGSVGMAAKKLSADTRIPVVYLAGDSTMTDQSCEEPYLPGGCYTSWGQSLAYFLGSSVAVDNQAHCGLTTESFRDEGHYQIVTDHMRPGDFCLFQFGHNDQKLAHLQAATGYRDNLLRYINEIRGLCGIPVLITPLARNTWREDGTYNDLLEEHARAVFEVGEETGVPVLDLHGFSVDLIKEKGKEASRVYFHPGDMTHPNEYGAWLFAQYIARSLSRIDPLTFQAEPAESQPLLPDDRAGIVTGAEADRNWRKEQKEAFDAMEKAEDSLVAAVEKARREAEKLQTNGN